MNLDLNLINTSSLVIVPIIIAIVQAIKLTGFIPDKFSPLLSIGVGIIISFMADHANFDLSNVLLGGCVYGLMASGLYSGIKTTSDAIQMSKKEGTH